MPIEVDVEITVFSEDEFHLLAHRVMSVVFGVHNEFGRLMNEEVYKQAISRRCKAVGIDPVQREVEVKIRYEDFEKSYFMDMLLASGLMVEAKTVEKLNNAHHAQALQYLLLTGMRHGLLVNLRPGEVEKRFVSTTIDKAAQRQFVIRDSEWRVIDRSSTRLRELFLSLLSDWGAFLQTSLYREAVIHFFGGPSVAVRRIPIYAGLELVGSHKICLIADDTAFALTALRDGKDQMKDHLRRFLVHTKLSCTQWVNIHNHDIEFRTLER